MVRHLDLKMQFSGLLERPVQGLNINYLMEGKKWKYILFFFFLASRRIFPRNTGCKVQKVYTSLGSSCHNAYTRFQQLLAHTFSLQLATMCTLVYPQNPIAIKVNTHVCMHEQATIGIWCKHCGRKYLNWCMPFGPYSQWKGIFIFFKVLCYMKSFHCRFSTNFVYYGITLNSSELYGNPFLNFFLSAISELPAYIASYYLLEKMGRVLTFSGSFLATGILLLISIFVPSGKIIIFQNNYTTTLTTQTKNSQSTLRKKIL